MRSLPHRFTAWALAGLLAVLCGVMLLLVIGLTLTPGYILRAFGGVMVNVADWCQRKIVRLMHWADKKLYPDEN